MVLCNLKIKNSLGFLVFWFFLSSFSFKTATLVKTPTFLLQIKGIKIE